MQDWDRYGQSFPQALNPTTETPPQELHSSNYEKVFQLHYIHYTNHRVNAFDECHPTVQYTTETPHNRQSLVSTSAVSTASACGILHFSSMSCANPEGGQGVLTALLGNHKDIGFLSITGLDPLENHKATKPNKSCQSLFGSPLDPRVDVSACTGKFQTSRNIIFHI